MVYIFMEGRYYFYAFVARCCHDVTNILVIDHHDAVGGGIVRFFFF